MIKLLKIAIVASIIPWVNADDITWANDTEIYDWSGASNLVLDTYTSYSIRIYKSVDDTIDFGLISPTLASVSNDDVWTGYSFAWNSGGADGFCYHNIFSSDTIWGINAGNKIYSVIFSDTPNSGYFAIIDNSLATVSYTAGLMSYDPGGVIGGLQSAGGDWQVIPEPATALLFILGSMGAWLVRRNNKMKADAEAEA